MEAIPGSQLCAARQALAGCSVRVWQHLWHRQRGGNFAALFAFPTFCEGDEPLSPVVVLDVGHPGRAGCFRSSRGVPVPRNGTGRLQDRLSNGKNVIKQENEVREALRAAHPANPGLGGCAEGSFLLLLW